MAQPSTADLDPTRQKLLKKKLGTYLDWTVPDIRPTIGPYDPAPFLAFEAKRREIVEACRDHLCTYNATELGYLVGDERETPETTVTSWSNFLRERIERLPRRMPAWHAAGFGHPDHVAEFAYWAKMPSFSVAELTCLSIGIEPDRFPNDSILSLQNAKSEGLTPALRFFLRRREQLQRKFSPREFEWQVAARDFVAWTASFEFEVHPEFLRLLKQYHRLDAMPPKTPADAKSIDKREIDTVKKLITLLAMAKFRYDPRAARSEVPKKIADFAAEKGIQITDETVRKYLLRGAGVLPPDG